ncbi:acetolactate synthase [Saprolegnia parasitica CBS 223.65]|uniref:Acetolactate synthase n=1 Tax=Saprolegnia parasitica (strain CBS 223.65) TaxID=695850 RepID=A0A067CIX8_SAPPC|nr:acetolactate synthase [Saprolegnia parasitica CBS 223.65]KDO29135.1 acetolactate synthase [Saprolegnia parasitica CBS 223.65]|eukprot:XP_012200015.1 acetolactate synthase [Saprolegnia parasitica CBS 223.65]
MAFPKKMLARCALRRFSELTSSSRSRRHVIAALVVNQTGCLAEIANLFAARGYNIDSLVVGRTDVPELSRMSVVVHGTDQNVWNMKKQLEDVVQVAAVKILTGQEAAGENVIERDLMLAKVSTHLPGSRSEVAELAGLFDAKVIDVTSAQVMVQLAGTPPRIEAFLELLKPMGITVEIAFQGANDGVSTVDDDDMDISKLPPG